MSASDCNTSAQGFQVDNFSGANLPSGASPYRSSPKSDGKSYDPYYTSDGDLTVDYRLFLRDNALLSSSGLSTLHTSPFSHFSEVDKDTGEVITKYYEFYWDKKNGVLCSRYVPQVHGRVKVKPSKATLWLDGCLMKVEKGGIKVEGYSVGGERSEIKGYSRASRRRFGRDLASTSKHHLPLFVTLTYSDALGLICDEKLYRDLDVFGKRFLRLMEREGKKGGFKWKKEYEVRKSGLYVGEEFPHLHLALWGMSREEAIGWISKAWYQVVGSGDIDHLRAGTQVAEVRSWRQFMGYVSKYMGKEQERVGTGRWWGTIGADGIPYSDETEEAITSDQAVKLIRAMRKCYKIKLRSRSDSLTVFCSPRQWLRYIRYLKE